MTEEPRTRNAAETQRRILNAAMILLAESGRDGFGINAIARQAGCDKQLIYRYFQGLEGIADAVGIELASKLEQDLATITTHPKVNSYAALMEHLALELLEILRRDRIMQQIIAWELTGPSDLTQRMINARGQKLGAWIVKVRGSLPLPTHIDAPAVNAIIIASTQQLVLSAASAGEFAGLPLKSDADWDRIRSSLSALVKAIYA